MVAARRPGAARAAAGGLGASRKLAAQLKAALPRGPVPARPGRAAERRRLRPRVATRPATSSSPPTTTRRTSPASSGANDGAVGDGGAGAARADDQAADDSARPSSSSRSTARRRRPGVADSKSVPPVRHPRRKVAAPIYRKAQAMILLDFVGEQGPRPPARGVLDNALWERLRRAAAAGRRRLRLPRRHLRRRRGRPLPVPAGGRSVDRPDRLRLPLLAPACDNLSAVSMASLDAVGEAMVELLRSFWRHHGRMTNVKARASRSPLIATSSPRRAACRPIRAALCPDTSPCAPRTWPAPVRRGRTP